MTEHQTTNAPPKSDKANRVHNALHGLFTESAGRYSRYARYPALELKPGVVITPHLVYTLLALLEECEGWLDPEYTDGEPLPLPVSVVDAMSQIYAAMEDK